MGQFSVEKPVAPGSVLSGNQHTSATQGRAMPACLQCNEEYQPTKGRDGQPRRGAHPQSYCSRPCQIKAANTRRASTRSGRGAGALRTPKSGAKITDLLPTLSTPPEAPNPVDRLAELMAKAHSKVGVTAFEIAEIARARKISPWAPLRVILGGP